MKKGDRVKTPKGEGYITRVVEVGAEVRYGVIIDKPNKDYPAMTKFFEEKDLEVAEVNDEWISVNDRLPRFYESVIISDGHGIDIGVLDLDRIWLDNDVLYYDVTHWRPLPELPSLG